MTKKSKKLTNKNISRKLKKQQSRGNKKYKDSVFRLLFSEKKNLLDLYNAIEGTNYDENSEIKMRTIKNAIFLKEKNDIAFSIEDRFIVLIEHQSTINPNMPLRMLKYITTIFRGMYDAEDIYGKKLIKIPTPEFYIIYNGLDDYPEEGELKLSSSYAADIGEVYLELRAKVYNVNYEKGAKLVEKCAILKEYSILIQRIREESEKEKDLKKAIENAVLYCKNANILIDFLRVHGGDVVDILYARLTDKQINKINWKDGYEDGIERGMEKGIERGIERGENMKAFDVAARMLKRGTSFEIIAEDTGLSIEQITAL